MLEPILPPRSNTVFQLLFGDPRNIQLLADFLRAVFNTPEDEFRDIVIVNPYLPREYADKKLGIVDLRLTTGSGQIVHVEIQRDYFSALRNRVLFYDSGLITGQIGESEEYQNMKRVVSILITGYPLIKESPLYHHRFTLYDPRAAVEFTDLLEIRTLELTKLPETPDVYLWHWLRFFRAETKEELDMVATASPAIQKATARVMKLSKDKRARLIYEYEVMARRDELSKLYDAREEGLAKGLAKGLEKGIEKGRIEERIALARNLLRRSRPIGEIAEDTGLSFDEIKKIKH